MFWCVFPGIPCIVKKILQSGGADGNDCASFAQHPYGCVLGGLEWDRAWRCGSPLPVLTNVLGEKYVCRPSYLFYLLFAL